MSFIPTTSRDIVKPLQFVEEGTTAATYGVIPTSSPTFTAAGVNTKIDLNPTINFNRVVSLGLMEISDGIKSDEVHAFTLTSNITTSTLAKYGFNATSGTGTNGASLSFLYSKYIDGTEYYTTMVGCRPVNTRLSVDRGLWELEQTWLAKDITVESTSHGLTSPTFATTPTAAPWGHAGMASSAFTWNSVIYPHRRLSVTGTFDYAIIDTNQDVNIIHARAATRRATISADVWKKSTALRDDYNAVTTRAATISVNSSGSSSFTLTDCRITDLSESHTAASSDGLVESLNAEVESVTLT